MTNHLKHLLAAAAITVAPLAAHAEVITFDDITNAYYGTAIPNGYAGFDWNNFYVLNGSDLAPSGYSNGTVSAPNVAYNGWGSPANFASVGQTPFTLVSADFTAAWNDGLTVQVLGYTDSILVDQTTFTVNTSGPTLETFDWANLTNVSVVTYGGTNHGYDGQGTQFALDNLAINEGPAPVSEVPEPISMSVLAAGLAGLGLVRRKSA